MTTASQWIAGVDGFKHQWFAVLQNRISGELVRRIVPTFAELLTFGENPSVVTVDIPIGLPEYAKPGGRACEREARKVLGPRASSVFSALGRKILPESTRAKAHAASVAGGGMGVGAQAWGLAKKLAQADAIMTADAQQVVREVHPEVCFWAMNGQVPIQFSKKSWDGIHARQQALIGAGFPERFVMPMAKDKGVGADDFLDACAALWTAARIAEGCAARLPGAPDLDARGLDQAIWY